MFLSARSTGKDFVVPTVESPAWALAGSHEHCGRHIHHIYLPGVAYNHRLTSREREDLSSGGRAAHDPEHRTRKGFIAGKL